MPTSDNENKNIVKEWFDSISPDRTFDIGAGSGTYSKLINSDYSHGKWTAIEAWAPYVDQFSLYDHYKRVIIGDARYLDYEKAYAGCPCNTTLTIMGDMLEHMSKDEAKELINSVMEYSNHIIISVPLVHYNQGAENGNWFEEHHDHWSYQEMCDFLGDKLIGSVEGDILGYFLWQK